MNEKDKLLHRDCFEQLMEAQNPGLMLKEFEDGGASYVTEYMLKIIDIFIAKEQQFLNDLALANPDKKLDDIGGASIKRKIEKAKQIKNVFNDRNAQKDRGKVKNEFNIDESAWIDQSAKEYVLRNYNEIYPEIVEYIEHKLNDDFAPFGDSTQVLFLKRLSYHFDKYAPTDISLAPTLMKLEVKDKHERIQKFINQKIEEIHPPKAKDPLLAAKQPQSQMPYFNDFLTEVQTLEVKVTDRYITDNWQIIEHTPEQVPDAPHRKAKFLDLSHYDQHKSNYEAELRRLQQLALSEFLNLSTDQIKRQLKRLEQLKNRFKQFWRLYKEQHKAFREGELTNTDLELKIYRLFIVNRHEPGSISGDFMSDLHDAAMFKQGYLKGFESEVKDAIEPEPEEKKDQPKRNELSRPAVAWFCRLVNKSELLNRSEFKDNKVFCKKVCSKYRLEYTDKVRQKFSETPTKFLKGKYERIIKDHIFPYLSEKDKEVICKEFEGKTATN